jgi:N-acylneuraminate cytidylyltransferase
MIPARGGSKEIPRKNLAEIAGHPLLAHAVRAAVASRVAETWVSSDDDEILAVAERYGARPLRRPTELATDTASSESALLHFAGSVPFDRLLFIQATSPLVATEDLDRGLDLLDDYDSVVSVTPFSHFLWVDGKPEYDLARRPRRQDRRPTFVETGSFYGTSRAALLGSGTRVSGRIGFCVVSKLRSFEVDSADDLDTVRRLMAAVR